MPACLALLALAAPLRAQELSAFAALRAAADGAAVFDSGRPYEGTDPEAPPFIVPVPGASPAAPPPPPALRRLQAGPRTMGYDALIRESAQRHGLDPRFVKAVIAGESEFVKQATSRSGARGLMQLMPATAEGVGVPAASLYRPRENIRAGTAYLAWLFEKAWKRYHLQGVEYRRAPDWLLQRILAAYNAGPRFLERRRLYRQTRAYVAKVLYFYRSALTELIPAPPVRGWAA